MTASSNITLFYSCYSSWSRKTSKSDHFEPLLGYVELKLASCHSHQYAAMNGRSSAVIPISDLQSSIPPAAGFSPLKRFGMRAYGVGDTNSGTKPVIVPNR